MEMSPQCSPPLTIDLRPALERVGGDRQLLRDLAEFFIEDTPELLQELEQGIETADAELVMRSAHSLKSMALSFDARECAAAAKVLETAAHSRNAAEQSPRIESLREEVGRVIDALKQQLLT